MWIWWVVGALALILGIAEVHDRRKRAGFHRAPDEFRVDRRETRRLHRAELNAQRHVSIGYSGGVGFHDGGGYFGGFDGCGGDGGGC